MEPMIVRFSAMEKPDWELLGKYVSFPEEEKRFKRFWDAANKAFDYTQPMLKGTCICSYYAEADVHGDVLKIGEVALRCPLFTGIQNELVAGVWVYFIRTDYQVLDGSLPTLIRTFSDFWGTLYLDSCRKQLEEILNREAQNQNAFLSVCFGPGYYGMLSDEMKKLYFASSPEKIQLQLTQAGTLFPGKSTGGLFLVMRKPMDISSPVCKNCLGDRHNCSFCRVNPAKENSKKSR